MIELVLYHYYRSFPGGGVFGVHKWQRLLPVVHHPSLAEHREFQEADYIKFDLVPCSASIEPIVRMPQEFLRHLWENDCDTSWGSSFASQIVVSAVTLHMFMVCSSSTRQCSAIKGNTSSS